MKKVILIVLSTFVTSCSSTPSVKPKVSIAVSQANQEAKITVLDRVSKSDKSMQKLANMSAQGAAASLGCPDNQATVAWENNGNAIVSDENPNAKVITLLVKCANGL
jgi:hypothetical protein